MLFDSCWACLNLASEDWKCVPQTYRLEGKKYKHLLALALASTPSTKHGRLIPNHQTMPSTERHHHIPHPIAALRNTSAACAGKESARYL